VRNLTFRSGVIVGVFAAYLVLVAWQTFSPATYPFYPRGAMAYMAPLSLAPNSVNVILVPADNSEVARGDVSFLCNGLEQWQDEGVDPLSHRWCKPL